MVDLIGCLNWLINALCHRTSRSVNLGGEFQVMSASIVLCSTAVANSIARQDQLVGTG